MSRNTAVRVRRAGWATLLLSLVIALAGFAPASAATARSISVTPSATAASLGSVVTLSGTLTKSPVRSSLTVQRKSGTSWVKVTTTRTTTKAGAYRASIVLPRKIGTYSYRVIAPKVGSLNAATSRVVQIAALTKVTATITATPKKVAATASTTLTGTVKPFVAGSTVSIQRQTGLNTWATVTSAKLTSVGKFGASVKPVNATTYRVAVPRRGTKAPAFSIGVRVDTTPVIATTSLPNGSVGSAYSTKLSNVGNQSGTWTAAPLPTGLSLNATTGVISGTPTQAEAPNVVIGFTQQYTGYTAPQKTLTLTVTTPPPPTPPTITTASPLTDAQVGVAYSKQLAADQSPGTWSTTTTLPGGITLSPGGLLSGTPTAIGQNPVTTDIDVKFTNTNTTLFVNKTLALTVNPPPPPPAPVILNQGPALPDGAALTAYSYQMYVSGNVAGTWGATGLPSGISIDATTGEISGTTLLPSNSTVTVTFNQTSPAVAATPKVYSLKIGALGSAKPATLASAGGAFSCRVDDARKLWCWGYDDSGQLGDGGQLVADPAGVSTPTQVGSATTWSGITTGGSGLLTERHACGLTGTTGYCWGSDKYGELGNGAGAATQSPAVVNGGRAWSSLAAGWTSTCGITTAGALFCWGDNTYGQVGVVTGLPQSTSPVAVGTASDWVQVSVGYNHACAVKGTGTLWCWGANFRGQLGNGTTDASPTPTQVGSASDWKSVTVGSGYTCAIKGTGTLWCWGPSGNGQLGNGTTVNDSSTDATSPLQVGSATDWKSVSADDGTTCAIKGAGELWCWGKNTAGQVGDNSTTVRSAPVRVGTDSDWGTVSVGASHACGVKAGDEIWCWGSNPKGELGSAPLAASVPAPRKVVG